jgi:hypothetical protein
MSNLDQLPILHQAAILGARAAMFHSKHFDCFSKSHQKEQPELRDELNTLQKRYHRFMEGVATKPRHMDDLLCWMVDVHGKTNADIEKIVKSDSIDQFRESINEQSGSLADLVRAALESWGFTPTDSGCGGCDWHIGTPCTNVEADQLCNMINIEFPDEIRTERLYMRRWFTKFRFRQLSNDDAVIQFVKDNDLEKYI